MTIIDTHVHLDHLENPEQALQEARGAGVDALVAVGVDLASCRKNLDYQNRISAPRIYLGFGIHPGNIKSDEIEETILWIRDHHEKAQAIGEIGLDFWYKWVRKDKEKKDEQRRVFARQLALAKEFDLPAVVHARGTWSEAFEMTKQAGIKRAVFHWYSGPLDVLKDIIDGGYFVSASPALADSPQSREAIQNAPIEQILIETDSPVFFRYRDQEGGFMAAPKDVFSTLKAYVELKNIDEDLARVQFNRNARNFFRMNDLPDC